MGVELETYSIVTPANRICRELHFPRRASIEEGERFTRDTSIGPEYNSKVFRNIREAFFLLKSGLRKYTNFRQNEDNHSYHVIFPVGGWTDRFAGTHLHISYGDHGLSFVEAKELSQYIFDHIPFLIVLAANSPVWRRKLTTYASNRLLKGSNTYCKAGKRGHLTKQRYRELTFNPAGPRKLSTLELRVCDSSLPEYIVAALSVFWAVSLRWLKKKPPFIRSTHANYLRAREQAMRFGPKARLVWSNHWVSVSQYVDLFFRKYADELRQMDIPKEVIDIFKYLKKGLNQTEVIRSAALKYRRRDTASWQLQFATRYIPAIQALLDGNTFQHFAKVLGVKLPNIERVWLGRREARW